MAYASSSRLSADLGRACVDKEGADVHLVARDRSRFPAHKAVISCRSEVLGALLLQAEGVKSDASGGADDAGENYTWYFFCVFCIFSGCRDHVSIPWVPGTRYKVCIMAREKYETWRA